jgi:hypothetical protein
VGLFWLGVWFVSSIVGTVLQGINEERQMHHAVRKAAEAQHAAQVAAKNQTPEQRQRQTMEQQAAQRKIWTDIQREQREAARTDWRPLFSYTANVARIGRHWLGADLSWERIAETVPAEERDQYLLQNMGPQYPWYWSAVVLAVLMGLSACVLNFRVKSLDRLK